MVRILLLHFSLQVPWEKFRKPNFEIFCLQNCNNWQYCFLCIIIYIIVTICHYTICTIVSFYCRLPGFFSNSRIVGTDSFNFSGITAFKQSTYRELLEILVVLQSSEAIVIIILYYLHNKKQAHQHNYFKTLNQASTSIN